MVVHLMGKKTSKRGPLFAGRCLNSVAAKKLLALGFAAYFPALFANGPELTTIFTGRWAVSTEQVRSQMLEVTLEPELKWRFEHGGELTGIARLRVEPNDGLRPTDMERASYAPASRPALIGDDAEAALREFYYENGVGDWYLTLGKQQVVWGKADGLKVLDVVNPQSFREFILEDFDVSRIALWTVNLERPIGGWDLQLLWIPERSYHALPEPGATYAFTSARLVPQAPVGVRVRLESPERPNRFFEDSDFGLRVSSFSSGWDVTLNYLYQYDNQPAFHQRLDMGAGGAPRVDVIPRYHRTHVLGGTASRAFGDWVVRGELGYFTERFFLTTDPSDADGLIESAELSYVLGLDWSGIDETFISAQLFQSWLPERNSAMTREALDTTLTFLIRRESWNDTLTAELLWLANLNDGDGLARPKVSYDVEDDVRLWLGLDLFYGGSDGLFGQFDDNDRLLLGLELGF